MMKFCLFLFNFCLLAVMVHSVEGVSPRTIKRLSMTESTDGKIIVNFSSQTEKISKNMPVLATFTVSNQTSEIVSVNLGKNFEEGLRLTIEQPSGERLKLPTLVKDGLGSVGEFSLLPKTIHQNSLLLNKWFEFEQIGRYMISAELAHPVRGPSGEIKTLNGKMSFEIHIVPEDRQEILLLANSLFAKVTVRGGSFQDVAEASDSLSYIKSPIAATFIEKAIILNPMVASILIPGLARIGGPTARSSLRRLAKSKDRDTADLARSSLRPTRKPTSKHASNY
jgi:hypothetical protein